MKFEFEEQLIKRLKTAHRIESSVQQLLAHMIEDASEPSRIRRLESCGLEAMHHKQRLLERLQSHGEGAPEDATPTHGDVRLDETGAPAPERSQESGGSLLIARLIASYELLEATANGAGDSETARVAGLNRSEDQAFVGVLFADHFDLFGAVSCSEHPSRPGEAFI
jgi:hypothetical protein